MTSPSLVALPLRARVLAGGLLGAVLGLPVLAFAYLGQQAAGLPSPSAELFEVITQRLPAGLVTRGIEVMVGALQRLNVGSTADAAKTFQAALGAVMLLGVMAALGGLYAALARGRLAVVAWGGLAAGLALLAVILPLGWLAAPSADSAVWLAVLALGWGVSLAWALARWRQSPGEAPPVRGRRRFLAQVGGWAAAVAAGSVGLYWLSQRRDGGPSTVAVGTPTPAPSGFVPVDGTRAEVTPIENFYVVDINLTNPELDAAEWRLAVEGLVDTPLSLSLDELRGLGAEDFYATLECISNNVGGDLISTTIFTGVPLARVLEQAGVQSGTVDIKFTCADGYTESLPLESALHPGTRLCYAMSGQPLTADHGFPVRLFTPNRFGMKNPKWITRIEAVNENYFGYWEQRRWSEAAWVKTTAVVDAAEVVDGAQIQAGGIAYAGSRGIQRVEVSLDDGDWQAAEVKPALSGLTWVLWRAVVPASPGRHRLLVRAVDGGGALQSAERTPPHPDGASGYHRVNVTV